MKTRNGLVSNSSSSSFVLIGIRKCISELTIKDISPDAKTIIIGNQLDEGRDVFALTDKMQLQFILDHQEFFEVAYVKALYVYSSETDGKDIDLIELISNMGTNKVILLGGRADQNSSYSIENMIQNYQTKLEEKIKVNMIENISAKYGVKKK